MNDRDAGKLRILWLSVLGFAVQEADVATPEFCSQLSRNARQYLTDGNGDFLRVCDLASIDPQMALREFRNRYGFAA